MFSQLDLYSHHPCDDFEVLMNEFLQKVTDYQAYALLLEEIEEEDSNPAQPYYVGQILVPPMRRGLLCASMRKVLILMDLRTAYDAGLLTKEGFSINDELDIREPDKFYQWLLRDHASIYGDTFAQYVGRVLEVSIQRQSDPEFGEMNGEGEETIFTSHAIYDRGMFYRNMLSDVDVAMKGAKRKKKKKVKKVEGKREKANNELIAKYQSMLPRNQ